MGLWIHENLVPSSFWDLLSLQFLSHVSPLSLFDALSVVLSSSAPTMVEIFWGRLWPRLPTLRHLRWVGRPLPSQSILASWQPESSLVTLLFKCFDLFIKKLNLEFWNMLWCLVTCAFWMLTSLLSLSLSSSLSLCLPPSFQWTWRWSIAIVDSLLWQPSSDCLVVYASAGNLPARNCK